MRCRCSFRLRRGFGGQAAVVLRRLSSVAEQQFCKLWVLGSNPRDGLELVIFGSVAEWSIATVCKTVVLWTTQVRILPGPPSQTRFDEVIESDSTHTNFIIIDATSDVANT